MKSITSFLFVPACILTLMTGLTARDFDRGDRGNRGQRPNVRPQQHSNRNPITQSKIDAPSRRPELNQIQRPSQRPAPQIQRPTTRPAPIETPQINRPQNRPAPQIQQRPEARPNIANRPAPGTLNRPENFQRPQVRPETLPGQVTYPRPQKPQTLPSIATKPAPQRPITRPGINSRPVQRPQLNYATNSGTKLRPAASTQWWDSSRPGTRDIYNQRHTQIQINNNFQNNVNWSTDRRYWGYNPWWNRPTVRPWYGGSWNCGWSSSYYHRRPYFSYYGGYRPWPGYVVVEQNNVANAIGWGLVGWSLGKLIYDCGYQSYRNPYPVQSVAVVNYQEPITVVAAKTAPKADDETARITQKSESLIAESQAAFKQGNYLVALESANKAIDEAPGDGALHEYRALILFALGKFSEAAGVLNPVLAGGPGWDWSTMIALYNTQEIYLSQLDALKNYSKGKPNAADARFLLGYHHMVCGHLEEAAEEFEAAAKLQPADSVSAQLRDLTKASSQSGSDEPTEPSTEKEVAPQSALPLEKLSGAWVSDKGEAGTVSLVFKDDGKFIWSFKKGDQNNEFSGDFSMNDNGLLVLDATESQMTATVSQPKDNELKFVLAGGPPDDPGLTFTRK
jgi:tetratricopeptide (TPR) repeat protein